MSKALKGVFAPITTPFVDEELSLERLRENVRKYSETPLAGFYVLGSNGEAKSLTEEEKLQVLAAVMDEKAPHQIVMAGAGYESTRQSIDFAKTVESMGVDFITLLAPSYFKKRMTDEAIIIWRSSLNPPITSEVMGVGTRRISIYTSILRR